MHWTPSPIYIKYFSTVLNKSQEGSEHSWGERTHPFPLWRRHCTAVKPRANRGNGDNSVGYYYRCNGGNKDDALCAGRGWGWPLVHMQHSRLDFRLWWIICFSYICIRDPVVPEHHLAAGLKLVLSHSEYKPHMVRRLILLSLLVVPACNFRQRFHPA